MILFAIECIQVAIGLILLCNTCGWASSLNSYRCSLSIKELFLNIAECALGVFLLSNFVMEFIYMLNDYAY